MMEIMNRITDKVGWDVKVFDEVITGKWRKEAMGVGGGDVSEKMMDWVKIYVVSMNSPLPILSPCSLTIPCVDK